MARRKPPEELESEDTDISEPTTVLPRRPRGTDSKATVVDFQSPGRIKEVPNRRAKRKVGSDLAEVIEALSDVRPDLIDKLIKIDRTARGETSSDAWENLLSQKDEILAIAERAEALLRDQLASSQRQEELVSQSERQGTTILERIAEIATHYQKLIERVTGDRDKLADGLAALRERHAMELGEQTERANDLWGRLESIQADADQRVAAATERADNLWKQLETSLGAAEARHEKATVRIEELEAEVTALTDEMHPLENKVRDAIASRDRLAASVDRLERKMEQAIFALREELDQSRTREKQQRDELDSAYEQIARLKARPH